jgi:DNA-binding NarL/FixJ family response regulator
MQKKLTILVVDRSPLVAPRIKDLLSNHKEAFLIGEARNAEEALTLFQFIPFDFVLLDLPVSEATALLTEIKQKYSSKIVMFFNDMESGYRNLYTRLGADYFIDKSSEFNVLEEKLIEELLVAA